MTPKVGPRERARSPARNQGAAFDLLMIEHPDLGRELADALEQFLGVDLPRQVADGCAPGGAFIAEPLPFDPVDPPIAVKRKVEVLLAGGGLRQIELEPENRPRFAGRHCLVVSGRGRYPSRRAGLHQSESAE